MHSAGRTRGRLVALALACLLLGSAGLIVLDGLAAGDVVSVGDTEVLELAPHADADGAYAHLDADDRVQILLTDELDGAAGAGVNPESVTDVGPVVTITNVMDPAADGPTVATVWVDHELRGSGIVEFTAPGHGPIEAPHDDEAAGRAVGVELGPGESVDVALRVDTRGVDAVPIESVRFVAVLDEVPAVERSEPARYTVTDLDAPDAVVEGDPIEVAATITNTGDRTAIQTVELRVGAPGEALGAAATVDAVENVHIAPGASRDVSFVLETGPDGLAPGRYDVGVVTRDDRATATVSVLRDAFFRVGAIHAPTEATVDEPFNVIARVTNTGEARGERAVALRAHNETIGLATRSVALDGNASRLVFFEGVSIAQAGTYQLEVTTGDHAEVPRDADGEPVLLEVVPAEAPPPPPTPTPVDALLEIGGLAVTGVHLAVLAIIITLLLVGLALWRRLAGAPG